MGGNLTLTVAESKLRSIRRQPALRFIPTGCVAEDNQGMNKERDLLPWILGGLSAATIAVAFAAVATHQAAATMVPPPVFASQPAMQPTVATPPPPSPAQAPPSAALPNSAPIVASTQAQTVPQPEIQTGQIWECTTKGVKTFSNNPCGEKSSLLEVGPINTMSATPAIHYARAYGSEPRYAPAYADQGASSDDEQYSQDDGAEAGGNSYTVVQGVRFIARRRPEHSHRPPPHHNSGHASGPAQR
jgi:hypothetical protein